MNMNMKNVLKQLIDTSLYMNINGSRGANRYPKDWSLEWTYFNDVIKLFIRFSYICTVCGDFDGSCRDSTGKKYDMCEDCYYESIDEELASESESEDESEDEMA